MQEQSYRVFKQMLRGEKHHKVRQSFPIYMRAGFYSWNIFLPFEYASKCNVLQNLTDCPSCEEGFATGGFQL
jgi:hypothetical protein